MAIEIYLLPLRDGISYAWPMKHRNTRLMSHRFRTYKTLASTLESDMLENLKFIWNHSRKTIKKKNMSKKDDLKPYTLPLQCCHCIFRCERWTCSKILNECGQLASYQKCSYFIGQMYARDEQMMTWSHLWGPNFMPFLVSFIPTMKSFQWIQTF